MSTDNLPAIRPERPAWNTGCIMGQKRALLPKHVWSIRVRLMLADNRRDLALFNMALDSKLRGCDLVRPKVRDVFVAGRVKERASVTQAGRENRRASRSPTRRANRLNAGSPIPRCLGWNISGPAVCTMARICRRDSMHVSCAIGSRRLGLSRAPMEPIRCVGRRWPRSTRRRETCGQFSFAGPHQDGQHCSLPRC